MWGGGGCVVWHDWPCSHASTCVLLDCMYLGRNRLLDVPLFLSACLALVGLRDQIMDHFSRIRPDLQCRDFLLNI